MRFYEFATPARQVLKISQKVNTPATPLPQNTPPTAAPAEPIRVYPRQWQRAWLQNIWQQRWLEAHKPSTKNMRRITNAVCPVVWPQEQNRSSNGRLTAASIEFLLYSGGTDWNVRC